MAQRENKVAKPVKLQKWMADALQKIADEKGYTFTAVVEELLRRELEKMGIVMEIGGEEGIGREAAGKLPESYPSPDFEKALEG